MVGPPFIRQVTTKSRANYFLLFKSIIYVLFLESGNFLAAIESEKSGKACRVVKGSTVGFMVFIGWILDNIFDVSVLNTFSSVMALLRAHHCFQSLRGIRLVKTVMGSEDLRFWLLWVSE
jgi:hypothetical protein